ncbi:MAG TPA: hypothetical protein DET40_08105 [Lentisphaeria bacterium]|nr:MAG: hypothetical protein A2X45_10315 [Lentisphaerae bacterium GWF2_50_93]HCE43497.1 hypothetical protein [Lentisphaeria bacterium]
MILFPSFFIGAMIYASVGFGGASLYLTLLSFGSTNHDSLAVTAMICNVIAVLSSHCTYLKAGYLRWKSAWPLIVASVPAAFVGGMFKTSPMIFALLLGLSLVTAGILMLLKFHREDEARPLEISWNFGGIAGAGIGLLSGVVGIGGGIFLAPLLSFRRTGKAKEIAALCALFILVNSLAGIFARLMRLGTLPVDVRLEWLWIAVLLGALAGGWIGATKLPNDWIKRIIAMVIIIGGINQLAKVLW